jgi:hypothetical protein
MFHTLHVKINGWFHDVFASLLGRDDAMTIQV